ncbi:MAG TPA: DUF86 domain-containing protein [Thermoanaerobaculia bacterium]|nr:DUF86 domain-containing protein [Thermoanaerobaculia bacterium]
MSRLDRELLAEKTAVIERNLSRIAERLPENPEDLQPQTDTADTVIFRLWRAVQGVIDLAMSACLHFRLGTPANYGEAFKKLAEAGYLERDLAARLVQAAGFRNAVVHAYDDLDIARAYRAAKEGPADLRAFLAALQQHI